MDSGWIISTILLTIGLLIFLFLWIYTISQKSNQTTNSCFGTFGVQTGVDANPINSCGTDRKTSCIFYINSLEEAENECNILSSICDAFTYNQSTSTMKIVQKGNTFSSPTANLFVRQSA
jgi:hypothetical protein